MKKILFLIGGLLSSIAINAQIISSNDAAILFSNENNNGTARFNAMGGAFGALGGNLSAGDINPAGLAVFNHSRAAFTLGIRNTDIQTSFYGTNKDNSNSYLNIPQAGGVLVFNSGSNSNWKRVTLGLNYSLVNDFQNYYTIKGNSGESDFQNDPYLNADEDPDNDVFYTNVDGQFFGNSTTGSNGKFTMSLAAQYNKNLYLGFSVVTHSIEFFQNALFKESNNDGNNNSLQASLSQKLNTYGGGIGIGVGLIAKPTQSIRLGLAYQSPVWYSLTDELVEKTEIQVSNNSQFFRTNDQSILDYTVTSPSKLTGSFAYVVGKEGLFSIDYTYKGYKNIKLNPVDSTPSSDTNDYFSNTLENTSSIRLGTEWRLDDISLRGGYFFEQSPYKNAIDTDHKKGYSLGVGFKFNQSMRLDLAYQTSKNTDVYGFLNIPDVNIKPAELDIHTSKVTATLVIGL